MIKFRAWEDRGKEYIKDVLIGSNGEIYFDDGVATQDDLDISVEQFTGLTDVNGKNIYVGDILKTKAGLIQIVEEGILAIDCEDIISGFYANNLSDGKPHTFSYDDEVIGNVHMDGDLIDS